MDSQELYNERFAKVSGWFKEGAIGKIDRFALSIVLESLGAKTNISEKASSSLWEYTNKKSWDGMVEVWGEERMKAFGRFCTKWVTDFESKEGNIELPKLDKSGRKDSGMKQFFHEITSYSHGILSRDGFDIVRVRLENGKLWQAGEKGKRIRIETPTSEGKKILIGSIPPGFPSDFFEWLVNSKA